MTLFICRRRDDVKMTSFRRLFDVVCSLGSNTSNNTLLDSNDNLDSNSPMFRENSNVQSLVQIDVNSDSHDFNNSEHAEFDLDSTVAYDMGENGSSLPDDNSCLPNDNSSLPNDNSSLPNDNSSLPNETHLHAFFFISNAFFHFRLGVA